MKLTSVFFILFFALVTTAQTSEDKNQNIKGLKLYPNPVTHGKVNIVTQQNRLKTISIFDVFGNIILTTKLYDKELDLSELHSGIYIIRIVETDKTANRKLIIK